MVLNYKGTVTSDMLVADMQKHVDWFTTVVRIAFFYAGQSVDVELDAPNIFIKYLTDNNELSGALSPETLEKLKECHANLSATACELIELSRAGQPITVDVYSRFEIYMDDYALQLREVEDEVMASGISIDTVTGLRSASGMKDDLRCEMDRRDRKETPFCVCNLSIDNIDQLRTEFESEILHALYAQVAESMRGMLRSFDDAYHLGNGEFVLCLKHVDLMDAYSVMERLIQRVEAIEVLSEKTGVLRVTASCGVVEPLPEETVDKVLGDALNTRREAQTQGGNLVFEYNEKSALSKVMQQDKGTS